MWLDRLLFLLLAYPFGWLIGLGGCLLEHLRLLRVEGRQHWPNRGQQLILASNHPSLWEPILYYYLFFRRYAFRLSGVPFSVPDSSNYFKRWYWRPARRAFIPVSRGGAAEGLAYRSMKQSLQNGSSLIIFPEGGRSTKGEAARTSRLGKSIRAFKVGAARLAIETGVPIVPVWIDGSSKVLPQGTWLPRLWQPVTIRIGAPLWPQPVTEGSDLEACSLALNERLMAAVIALADGDS